MFRHHISAGAILSMIGVMVVFFYSLIVDPLQLGILFAIGTFGSVLPDFDSDSGLPFYLAFGGVTLAFTGFVLYHMLSGNPTNYYELIGIPLAAMVGFWVIVGAIVKHTTHHRGIWHSMPMLGVVSVSTYLLALYVGQEKQTALLYGAAMAGGFLSHLVLDELWSTVNHDGNPFTYKQSLGTAMKFFSESYKINFLTYVLLIGLVYVALHPEVLSN
jgi:LexA-binding, inner membrane-associated putative hydrolase